MTLHTLISNNITLYRPVVMLICCKVVRFGIWESRLSKISSHTDPWNPTTEAQNPNCVYPLHLQLHPFRLLETLQKLKIPFEAVKNLHLRPCATAIFDQPLTWSRTIWPHCGIWRGFESRSTNRHALAHVYIQWSLAGWPIFHLYN